MLNTFEMTSVYYKALRNTLLWLVSHNTVVTYCFVMTVKLYILPFKSDSKDIYYVTKDFSNTLQ